MVQHNSNLPARPGKEFLQSLEKDMVGFSARLFSALPENINPKQFLHSIMATVASSQRLQQCTAQSILLAAYQAASLGLPVNDLGLAYLVPYGNNAKLQIGWRGYVQLVTCSGHVLKVDAHLVYKGDLFKYYLGTDPRIDHEANEETEEVTHAYAIAYLSSGLVQICVMNRKQIEAVRGRSQSATKGPWVTDFEAMCYKTIVKRLCKRLPATIPSLQGVKKAMRIEEETYNTKLSPAALRPTKPLNTNAWTQNQDIPDYQGDDDSNWLNDDVHDEDINWDSKE